MRTKLCKYKFGKCNYCEKDRYETNCEVLNFLIESIEEDRKESNDKTNS